MRLWVPADERRPDPAPLTTDDRVPVVVGLLGWVIALGVVVALIAAGVAGVGLPALWLCVAGLVLAVVLIGYTQVHRRR